MSTQAPTLNKAREYRIDMEAVVDAYNETERAMGWYYHLDEKLQFPFNAKCTVRVTSSPLKIGQTVKVIRMASADDCEFDMLALIEYDDDELAVPLAQLASASKHAATKEAIADWHYWLARGYQF